MSATKSIVPQALADRPQWVMWRRVTKRGKPSKIPFTIHGEEAKSNTPASWSTFDEVVAAFNTGEFAGIGYVFAADDPFVGVDLDGCREQESGAIEPWAREILDSMPAAYVEVSPSGTGVKLWCCGEWKSRRCKLPFEGADHKGIEAYAKARFFCFTGRRLGDVIEPGDCQEGLDHLARRFDEAHERPSPPAKPAPTANGSPGGDRVNVPHWLARHGVEVLRTDRTDDADRWFIRCPGIERHTTGDGPKDCCVTQDRAGKLGGHCLHSSCGMRDWQSLKGAIGPIEAIDYGSTPRKAGPARQVAPPSEEPPVEEWPEPAELDRRLPDVPRFDPELLPSKARAFVVDVAERIQCPIDYVAASMVIVMATVIGRKIAVRPKRCDNWTVVPNLWGMVVGRPGVMKTPAISEPLRFLKRLEAEAKREYEEALRDHEARTLVAQSAGRASRKRVEKLATSGNEADAMEAARAIVEAEALTAPIRRRYQTQDSSVEALGKLMAENPRGLAVVRDELSGLLRSLDPTTNPRDRAYYIEGWNGGGLDYEWDRIGRGNVSSGPPTLCVFGGIQPGPLRKYIQTATACQGDEDDGLVPRLQLAVWPDVDREWCNIDRWPDTAAKNDAWELVRYLDQLTPEDVEADTSEEIPFLRFDDEALERFVDWRARLEPVVRGAKLPEALESHLSKYRSLIPTLALIYHLADGGVGPVSRLAVDRAIAWGAYLWGHAQRIYDPAGTRGTMALADRIRDGSFPGDGCDTFTVRDVYKRDWAGLDKKGAAAAVEVLLAANWLRVVDPQAGKGGRPTLTYQVNPRVADLAGAATDDDQEGGDADLAEGVFGGFGGFVQGVSGAKNSRRKVMV